jgi:hypothetical protein
MQMSPELIPGLFLQDDWLSYKVLFQILKNYCEGGN